MSKKYADEALFRALDEKAEQMKQKVLSAKPDLSHVKRKFYVRNNGCDGADGLTPETAWASLARVARADLQPGDAVLFRCGDLFRGDLRSKRGITYSSYGEGEKPILCGSKQNYADPSLWRPTEYKNIWRMTLPVYDVGLVALDHHTMPGGYDEKFCKMRQLYVGGFNGLADLVEDTDFYCDMSTDTLYLCSEENPGARFFSIEVGENRSIIAVTDDCTVDGLCFCYTGGHATNALTCHNLTIRNNVYAWLGGSILLDCGHNFNVRYGNAVEIFGAIDGYTVENNWMYQIYDTAVTHQFSGAKPGDCLMQNIRYEGNLMEYCHWCIEFYDAPHGDTKRTVRNVYMNDNFCRFGGEGWGTVQRGGRGLMFCASGLPDDVTNNIVENTIIDRSKRGYPLIMHNAGSKKLEFRNTTYVQYEDALLANAIGEELRFDENAEEAIRRITGEAQPNVYFVRSEQA